MQFNHHLNALQLEVLVATASGRRDEAPAEYELHIKDCTLCRDNFYKLAVVVRGQCDDVQKILPLLGSPTSPITDEERMVALRHLSLCGSCWQVYELQEQQDAKIFQGEKL